MIAQVSLIINVSSAHMVTISQCIVRALKSTLSANLQYSVWYSRTIVRHFPLYLQLYRNRALLK